MGGATVSWLLLLAAEASDLTLPHGEASRPLLCAPSAATARGEPTAGARGASPWDRVRQQPVEALCTALARIQIRLQGDSVAALEAAQKLVREWPGRAEPKVLEARALLARGEAAQSFAAWQVARQLARDSGREPGAEAWSAHAQRDYAVAAALSGHADVAAETYRRLVSLLDAWPDPRHVQRLYLEAASASLRRSPPAYDEALGYLSAAESRARSTGLRTYAAGLHALLRARRGVAPSDPSWLDAPEIWHLVELARAERLPSYWPRVPRHEVYGLASLLVERFSATEAAELWDSYVQGIDTADAELASFARARQVRLSRAGAAP